MSQFQNAASIMVVLIDFLTNKNASELSSNATKDIINKEVFEINNIPNFCNQVLKEETYKIYLKKIELGQINSLN